jgi:hypothetical protein
MDTALKWAISPLARSYYGSGFTSMRSPHRWSQSPRAIFGDVDATSTPGIKMQAA